MVPHIGAKRLEADGCLAVAEASLIYRALVYAGFTRLVPVIPTG